MKKFIMLVLISWIAVLPQFSTARENNETAGSPTQSIAVEQTSQSNQPATGQNTRSTWSAGKTGSVFAPFSAFPNLHPLIVHFPVVLLLLSFLSQLMGLFVFRKEMSWITLTLLIGGFVGAILAAQVFHPHPDQLPENLERIFEAHEQYAMWTMWLSGIGLFLKLISHFFLKRKLWMEIIVALLLTGSAITVTLAGHLGAELVYVKDVGPQGHDVEED